MDRRQYLGALGVAGTAVLAGCGAVSNLTGSPEMEWEYQYESFVGGGFQPVIFVTGEIENVGDAPAEEFELTAELLNATGNALDSRRKMIRSVDPNEEQMFHYRFNVSGADVDRVEEVEVTGEFPEN